MEHLIEKKDSQEIDIFKISEEYDKMYNLIEKRDSREIDIFKMSEEYDKMYNLYISFEKKYSDVKMQNELLIQEIENLRQLFRKFADDRREFIGSYIGSPVYSYTSSSHV